MGKMDEEAEHVQVFPAGSERHVGAQRPGGPTASLGGELRTDCSHVDCVLGAVLLQAVT